jgi:hypothetical protein
MAADATAKRERLPEKSIASGMKDCGAKPFSEWLNYPEVTMQANVTPTAQTAIL